VQACHEAYTEGNPKIMTALGEGRIGVLSDGGSIPLTSTIEVQGFVIKPWAFLSAFIENACL